MAHEVQPLLESMYVLSRLGTDAPDILRAWHYDRIAAGESDGK